MIAQRSPDGSIRSALRIPLRHKGKVIAVFLAVVFTTLLGTALTSRTYRSEGKLLVRLGRENMAIDPTATLGTAPLLAIQQTRENEINSVIEIMRSRMLMEKVVDAVGRARIMGKTDDDAVDIQDAIRQLTRNLEVEAVRKSNVLQITYDATSPELAQAVLDKVIACFLEEHIRLNRTPGAEEFLDEQTASIRQRMQEREEQLRAVKDETGLASPEARRNIIVTRIGRLEDDLLQTKANLTSTDAEIKQLQKQLNDLPATQVTESTVGFANVAADGMRQQLYTLQLREKELASRVTETHPQLLEVRQQIAEAQSLLGQEKPERTQTKTGLSKTHEELNLQLLKEEPVRASLTAKCDRLATQLSTEKASLSKLNEDELRVARLQREVQLEDANYRKYVDSLEQARIDRAMATEGKSNISIVQPASTDPRAIKPKTLTNLLLAIIVGLIGGLGFAYAADSFEGPANSVGVAGHHREAPVRGEIQRVAPRQLAPANGDSD